jgi:hypothetical protein
MSLEDKLSQLRSLLAQRDEIDSQIEAIIGHNAPKQVETRQRKWNKANKKGRKLQEQIEGEQPIKGRHPATEQIEGLLIDGLSVPAILEKVEVSAPTVYVIRNRLKREGKLA